VMALATSIARPVSRLKCPKAVPRNSGGVGNRDWRRPWMIHVQPHGRAADRHATGHQGQRQIGTGQRLLPTSNDLRLKSDPTARRRDRATAHKRHPARELMGTGSGSARHSRARRIGSFLKRERNDTDDHHAPLNLRAFDRLSNQGFSIRWMPGGRRGSSTANRISASDRNA
jgi:hypothetical protein